MKTQKYTVSVDVYVLQVVYSIAVIFVSCLYTLHLRPLIKLEGEKDPVKYITLDLKLYAVCRIVVSLAIIVGIIGIVLHKTHTICCKPRKITLPDVVDFTLDLNALILGFNTILLMTSTAPMMVLGGFKLVNDEYVYATVELLFAVIQGLILVYNFSNMAHHMLNVPKYQEFEIPMAEEVQT